MTRGRGTYGPLDRDRHLVLGWTADRIVGYAHDRTVGAALRPVLPAVNLATRTSRSAGRLWAGTKLIGGRHDAEKPPSVVGQELFHTVADRERAIGMLSTGFKALASDLAVWQTSNSDKPDAALTAQWLAADVTPTIDEWNTFVEHEGKSWWTKLATSWETFEEWWNRLKQLRALARAHGVMLQSAELVPLPKTIWQKSAEGKGSEATALLGVLKIGALTVLAIMGAAGLYAVVRDLRPKQSPEAHLREILREELSKR